MGELLEKFHIEAMHNQGIQQRAAFDGEDIAHRLLVARIRRQAINGLRRQCDHFSLAQQFRGAFHAGGGRGQDRRQVRVIAGLHRGRGKEG